MPQSQSNGVLTKYYKTSLKPLTTSMPWLLFFFSTRHNLLNFLLLPPPPLSLSSMAFNISRLDAQSAAEKAVSVIGLGYDLSSDVRLSACKSTSNGSRLVEIDPNRNQDLVFPGGVIVSNVSSSIKCDKGERTRFRSDILSFNQVRFGSFSSFTSFFKIISNNVWGSSK